MILTRYNLPTSGLESRVRAREGWLRDRTELFLRYCAPSVARQRDTPVDWLVYFDPDGPAWLRDQLRPLVDTGLFRPIYRTSVTMADLVEDLRSVVKVKSDFLVTTNLDNDDALAIDACKRVTSVNPYAARTVIYMERGLVKSPTSLYQRIDRRNAFVSVMETWDDPVTSWSEYHNEFPRLMPAITLKGEPGWLQVVHGSNVSNRVRGRLVSPAAHGRLFPGMLDDLDSPTRLDIGLDLMALQPARLMRDTVRSAARRSALTLIGKERYSQLKLSLASLRSLGRAE